MLDRSKAPSASPIENIEIPLAQQYKLANGIPVYYLNISEQEAVKIDLIFKAGTYYENEAGSSYMVSKMILEGTNKLNSNEIVSKLDYYGAFVETNSGFDQLIVTIYTLTKFTDPVLAIIHEVLQNSIFPQKEFDLAKKVKIQDLKINESKNNIVAARRFRQNLLGKAHPYGQILDPRQLTDLDKDSAFDFYESRLFNAPEIIVSGNVKDSCLKAITNNFQDLSILKTSVDTSTMETICTEELIEVKDSMQSSIRIGKHVIDRLHEDTHLLAITNSLFGGFFGSRLMKNIREEKGYTYGVYSSVAHLKKASFMVISTDVKREFTSSTISEIKKEIKRLQNEKVTANELNTVTNYLTGQFLSGLDSPFSIANKFKMVNDEGLDYQFYYDYLDTLKSISPAEIMEIANKYFREDDLIQVVVGGY